MRADRSYTAWGESLACSNLVNTGTIELLEWTLTGALPTSQDRADGDFNASKVDPGSRPTSYLVAPYDRSESGGATVCGYWRRTHPDSWTAGTQTVKLSLAAPYQGSVNRGQPRRSRPPPRHNRPPPRRSGLDPEPGRGPKPPQKCYTLLAN